MCGDVFIQNEKKSNYSDKKNCLLMRNLFVFHFIFVYWNNFRSFFSRRIPILSE